MKLYSAKQAWADVHEGFCLSPRMEGFGSPPGSGPACYHCPFCRQAGFMRELPAGQGVVVSGVRMAWRCGACHEFSRRPLLLKRRGSITATQSRVGRAGAGDYRIVDGLQAGRVLSVIEKLPEHCYTWGMWVYTGVGLADLDKYDFDLHYKREQAILGWLADMLDKSGVSDVRDDAEADAEQALMLMVLRDTRQVERCGRRLYSTAAIAEVLGVDRRCMDARYKWGQRLLLVKRALESLTAEALGPVAVVVEQLRGREVRQREDELEHDWEYSLKDV